MKLTIFGLLLFLSCTLLSAANKSNKTRDFPNQPIAVQAVQQEINYTPVPVSTSVNFTSLAESQPEACPSSIEQPMQEGQKKYCCIYLLGICACESTGLDQCLVDCADWYP